MARHVIVDGSNIATEGRTMPSLKQLNEAVTAFMQEFPHDVITVVVDATFGHRIDPSEVPEFDEAVAHNELVAPPAGAIGRGDSFILSIANKTKGSILTNDSYQEFHGQYPWVFDEGRLIGGKPVPNVGWVFVLRTPVRGPVSRKSVRAGRSVDKNTGRVPRASKEASLPMPVPKAPPPGATIGRTARAETSVVDGQQPVPAAAAGGQAAEGGRRRGRRDGHAAGEVVRAEPVPAAPRPAPARDEPVNELMAFINFVEHHPVGSSVNAVVESYSSHGAYVAVGDVRGYVPLRLMSDPPARTARELGKVGDAVTLVVHSFTPARRSIDMAVPAAATKDGVAPTTVPVEPHEAETAAIAEAAVIATAADTAAGEAAVVPARPGRRPRKAAATAGTPPSSPTLEPLRPAAASVGVAEALPEPAAAPPRKAGGRTRKAAAGEVSTSEPAVPQPPVRKRPRRAAEAAPATQPEQVIAPAPSKRAARATARVAGDAAAVPAPAKRAARQAAGAETVTSSVLTPAVPSPAGTVAAPSRSRRGAAAATQPPPVERAPLQQGPAKKAAAKKAAPAEKASVAKKSAPVQRAGSAEKPAAVQQTAPGAKAAPAKRAVPATKPAPAKTSAPAEKAAKAKKSAPSKKAAPVEKAAPVKKRTAAAKASATP